MLKLFKVFGTDHEIKTQNNKLLRSILFSGLGVALMMNASLAENQESNFALSNKKIVVNLDQSGITSLEDLGLGKTFKFSKDNFSITIDSQEYNNEILELKDIKKEKNKISFLYKSAELGIQVNYELEKEWRFLSKQIIVTAEKKAYIVDHVRVFDAQLEENPSGEYIAHSPRPHLKTGDYGTFLRFEDRTGMFVLVQNPFLKYKRDEGAFTVDYQPDMEWKSEYGAFSSDRGCVGTYALSGQSVSGNLIPEWRWTHGVDPVIDEVQDWSEVDAFTKCVRAFILPSPKRAVNMHIGWCGNDYQIDIATKEGREEYKRIIDQCADIGMDYILFAPTNSELGSREETADDWSWENLLWLGLGIKIRKGEWDPRTDVIPASLQEMLDYAAAKNIKLVAYMYPVMPFEGNQEWIVEDTPYHRKKRNASMGFRSFQDHLIDLLSTFYEKTGLGGYAYDYTFLWYDKPSRYSQWWGWKRIKETLRDRFPEIVIDGRQLDMLYGPWTWLSGSYPHPTAADEQPESFNPFPDLHFDRASAHRQRFTAYRYRVNDYCPPELIPGFITHQTSRKEGDTKPGKDGKKNVKLRLDSFRARDWDYLGWKYSLFSSIGTGGLNNAVSMIPARDMDEFKHFSDSDKKFFRDWMDWTEEHYDYLLNTRPIIGQPAIGRIDGTSAIVANHGFIFLFNPNGRKLTAEFTLDESIGLSIKGSYVLKERYPGKGKFIGKPYEGTWNYGDRVSLPMEGASAMVIELQNSKNLLSKPLLFNVQGIVKIKNSRLEINKCEGIVGAETNALILLPERKKVESVIVNGKNIHFDLIKNRIVIPVRFDGVPFSHMQQADVYNPDFTGGTIKTSVNIPKRIFNQLNKRKEEWPIPWTKEDYKTTWLVPHRLLLFLQIADVKEDMDVKLKINGKPINLSKAYTSVRAHSRCFVGFYTDISHLNPDINHIFELSLPELQQGQYQGLFFENVETEYTTELIPD